MSRLVLCSSSQGREAVKDDMEVNEAINWEDPEGRTGRQVDGKGGDEGGKAHTTTLPHALAHAQNERRAVGVQF